MVLFFRARNLYPHARENVSMVHGEKVQRCGSRSRNQENISSAVLVPT